MENIEWIKSSSNLISQNAFISLLTRESIDLSGIIVNVVNHTHLFLEISAKDYFRSHVKKCLLHCCVHIESFWTLDCFDQMFTCFQNLWNEVFRELKPDTWNKILSIFNELFVCSSINHGPESIKTWMKPRMPRISVNLWRHVNAYFLQELRIMNIKISFVSILNISTILVFIHLI